MNCSVFLYPLLGFRSNLHGYFNKIIKRSVLAILFSNDLEDLSSRAKLVTTTFGTMSGSALKDFVYATFPEITTMRWGDPITI